MIQEAFRLGGWGMYPTAFFGLVLVAAAVRHAVRPEGRWVPLLISLGLVTLLAGALGFVTGLIASLAVLERVGPDERYLTLIGLGESLHNLGLALVLVLVGALAAAVGAYRLGAAAGAASRTGPAPSRA